MFLVLVQDLVKWMVQLRYLCTNSMTLVPHFAAYDLNYRFAVVVKNLHHLHVRQVLAGTSLRGNGSLIVLSLVVYSILLQFTRKNIIRMKIFCVCKYLIFVLYLYL